MTTTGLNPKSDKKAFLSVICDLEHQSKQAPYKKKHTQSSVTTYCSDCKLIRFWKKKNLNSI